MMKRQTIAVLLGLAIAACGPSETRIATPDGGEVIKRQGKVDIVTMDVRKQTHEEAVAEARATFPHFLKMQASKQPHLDNFAAKVALPTNDKSFEHIWVLDVKASGDGYTGVLNNDPYNLAGGLKIGDRVSFTLDRLTDWGYGEHGKQRGHFTTRLILEQTPPEEAAMISAMLHEQPMPSVNLRP
ncbi:MAG: DUF2314 domain-containing protein [Pseudomonadota bacterium]